MTIQWPLEVLEPEKIRFDLSGGRVSGQASLVGIVQTGTFGGGGFWMLSMTRIPIMETAHLLAQRALRAALDNGTTPVIIAIPDYGVIEELSGGEIFLQTGFADGVPFSDGATFATGALDVETVGAAALAGTSLRLKVNTGPEIQAGMVFSVLDENGYPRRHEISWCQAVDGETGQFDVRFRVPLRGAVASGAPADFNAPACVMKLADPESMSGDFEAGRWGEISPTFVEYFGVE